MFQQYNAHSGVSALARSLGVSDQSVRVRLRKGLTLEQVAEEIRENARRREAGMPVKGKAPADYRKALEGQEVGSKPGPEGRSYTPANRKATGKSFVVPPTPQSALPPLLPKPDSRYPKLDRMPEESDGYANGPNGSTLSSRFNFTAPAAAHAGMSRDDLYRAQALAQVLKEQGLAAQAQFKARQMDGELIDRAATYGRMANLVVKARDILTRIGPEQRDRLAACTDPVECENIVQGEVLRALSVLKEFGSNSDAE